MSGSNLWRFREFIFSVGMIMSNSLSLLFCQRNSLYTHCVLQVCRIHTKSRTTTANIFIINMDNTYNYVPLSTEPLVLCEKLFLAWKRHHNQWRFQYWKVERLMQCSTTAHAQTSQSRMAAFRLATLSAAIVGLFLMLQTCQAQQGYVFDQNHCINVVCL